MVKPTDIDEEMDDLDEEEGQFILVVSKKSGAHVFNESDLHFDINSFQALRIIEGQQDAFVSKRLVTQLTQLKINFDGFIETIDNPIFYRAVFGDWDPLGTVGSFSCGGRYHVGTAQSSDDSAYKNLAQKCAGLYVSLDVKTSEAEMQLSARTPPNVAKMYNLQLSRKNRVSLLNCNQLTKHLDLCLTGLSSPLSEEINRHPLASAWEYVKVPKPSQIIGQWLRSNASVDGLVFDSTRHDGRNCFLFSDNAHTAADFLSSTFCYSFPQA